MNTAIAWGVTAGLMWVLFQLMPGKSKTTVTSTGPLSREVTRDGRVYIVQSFGSGIYYVGRKDNPGVSLVFNQQGPIGKLGEGTPAFAELQADMQQFPKELFT